MISKIGLEYLLLKETILRCKCEAINTETDNILIINILVSNILLIIIKMFSLSRQH